MERWLPLTALAFAQFVMVLDQAVMNGSISQLVEDFEGLSPLVQAASSSRASPSRSISSGVL